MSMTFSKMPGLAAPTAVQGCVDDHTAGIRERIATAIQPGPGQIQLVQRVLNHIVGPVPVAATQEGCPP
jgi:hypothetical protein